MKTLALAIIAQTFEMGIDWVRRTYGDDIRSFNRTEMRGSISLHNVERPFIVISSSAGYERLRGQELIGFEIVGYVDHRLLDLAFSMVRS